MSDATGTPVSGWGQGWGDRGDSEPAGEAAEAKRPEGYDPGAYRRRPYDQAFDEGAYGSKRRGAAPGRRSRLRTAIKILALLVALLLVVGGIGLFWAESQINPGGRRGPDVTVVIPQGSSKSEIGRILSRAGVIHDATLFALYIGVRGSGILYPGTYHLARNSSYESAISALENGPALISDTLVVPEGFTVRDIAAAVAALPGLHLSAPKFVAAATDGTVRSPYEPAGVTNLEGLLFPATYKVQQGDTEVDIVQEMVTAFDQRAQSIGLAARAAQLGETPYQLVTVASIVEREAKFDSDRGPVASVIYNRLKAGMTLGDDSTQTYYLRLTDPTLMPTFKELEQPGPYNTRLNKGLPPTPIANPGLPSLEAAADPPSTDYLYFVVVKPDGQLAFASTYAAFQPLEEECLNIKQCT